MIITLNLELGEIERSRIFTSEKTGKKYLSLVLFDHKQPDPYGNDGYVAHSLSKAERETGRKGKTVGNWKFVVRPGNGAVSAEAAPAKPVVPAKRRPPAPMPAEEDLGELPF
jgi:hypothetical protein